MMSVIAATDPHPTATHCVGYPACAQAEGLAAVPRGGNVARTGGETRFRYRSRR